MIAKLQNYESDDANMTAANMYKSLNKLPSILSEIDKNIKCTLHLELRRRGGMLIFVKTLTGKNRKSSALTPLRTSRIRSRAKKAFTPICRN